MHYVRSERTYQYIEQCQLLKYEGSSKSGRHPLGLVAWGCAETSDSRGFVPEPRSSEFLDSLRWKDSRLASARSPVVLIAEVDGRRDGATGVGSVSIFDDRRGAFVAKIGGIEFDGRREWLALASSVSSESFGSWIDCRRDDFAGVGSVSSRNFDLALIDSRRDLMTSSVFSENFVADVDGRRDVASVLSVSLVLAESESRRELITSSVFL